MGLMAGNPYTVENPWAAAINGFRSGFKETTKSLQDAEKVQAEIAAQEQLRQIQQQAADRAKAEADREAAGQAALQKLFAPTEKPFYSQALMPQGDPNSASYDPFSEVNPIIRGGLTPYGQQIQDAALQGVPKTLDVPAKYEAVSPAARQFAIKEGGLLASDFPNVPGTHPLAEQYQRQIAPATTQDNPAYAAKLAEIQGKMQDMGGTTIQANPSAQEVFRTLSPYLQTKEFGNTYKEMGLTAKPDTLPLSEAAKLFTPESIIAWQKSGNLSDLVRYEKDKPDGYKQRNYDKGDQHISEESYDGGKTWQPLATAPRYKPVDPNGKSHAEFKDVMALRKEFSALPEVKDYATIEAQAKRAAMALESSLKSNTNMPVDQTVITTFNKMLDPSSVVRESEYARTPQDMSILSNIKGKWDKIQKGGAGLNLQERTAMLNMVNNFKTIADAQYNAQVNQYSEIARRNNFDPADVIRLGHNQSKNGNQLGADALAELARRNQAKKGGK